MRDGFDPQAATTWNDEERAVYETGHREGGSDVLADWNTALDAADLPTDLSMGAVVKRLAELLESEHEETHHVDEPDEWCPKCPLDAQPSLSGPDKIFYSVLNRGRDERFPRWRGKCIPKQRADQPLVPPALPSETLLRSLAGHTEGVADLLPGGTVLTRLLDEPGDLTVEPIADQSGIREGLQHRLVSVELPAFVGGLEEPREPVERDTDLESLVLVDLLVGHVFDLGHLVLRPKEAADVAADFGTVLGEGNGDVLAVGSALGVEAVVAFRFDLDSGGFHRSLSLSSTDIDKVILGGRGVNTN